MRSLGVLGKLGANYKRLIHSVFTWATTILLITRTSCILSKTGESGFAENMKAQRMKMTQRLHVSVSFHCSGSTWSTHFISIVFHSASLLLIEVCFVSVCS